MIGSWIRRRRAPSTPSLSISTTLLDTDAGRSSRTGGNLSASQVSRLAGRRTWC